MKAGGVAYGGLRIGRCARSWATIRKSRVVINPIQTRLADWLHAQRCRTTCLVALTSIVRGPWPRGVASVYSVTRTGPPAKGLYPARVASLAGFSLLGDSHLRRVTPPPGSIDAQNLTCAWTLRLGATIQIERSKLPTAGKMLAEISGGKVDGDEHDRMAPERMKATIY